MVKKGISSMFRKTFKRTSKKGPAHDMGCGPSMIDDRPGAESARVYGIDPGSSSGTTTNPGDTYSRGGGSQRL